ncbi:MAG TPA: tRNA (adenosine(37)-N6)-dimethylallyltransferase MiaA [Chthoniobacter sp.]
MPPSANHFFVIAGPTAIGKSEIAVEVAERCGGEIIGADAFQVYQGLDILTAKPSQDLQARVPHHLIGEIPLAQAFDVAQYLEMARDRIEQIRRRGRLPIVVGGTGMYLRALIRGLAELPGANADLRAELERRSLADLQKQLTELDPQGASQLDMKNPRRVVRALEICLLTGRPFSSFREQWTDQPPPACGVVLSLDRPAINARIDRRTAAMFEAGVIDEVRACAEIGLTASQVLGWREIRGLLCGELDQSQCAAAIAQATRQYAKRQMTWFRREPALEMVSVTTLSTSELIDRLTEKARAVTE